MYDLPEETSSGCKIMRPVFGQTQDTNQYLTPKCKTCFRSFKTGRGTKLVGGKKVHFDKYGCSNAKECLKEKNECITE